MLVAGIGNIFFGDDGFGVAVADRLATMPARDGVTIADYGIRGVHLALELLDHYDLLVLVDALAMGEPPGTVALFEPEMPERSRTGSAGTVVDAHSMSPAVVLGHAGRARWIDRTGAGGRLPARDHRGRHRAVRRGRRVRRAGGGHGRRGPGRRVLDRNEWRRQRMRKLLFVGFVAAVTVAVREVWPDVSRYLKIRDM